MGEHKRLADEAEGTHRGAHAAELAVLLDGARDERVRVEQHLRHGVLGVVGARVLLVVLGEVLDGDRARDITARVTTHAVGHDEQVGSDEPGVLVVASDLADVGHGAGARDDQHAYRSSNVVVPMRTGVPTGTWVGWETRLPLTYVPFVESRSCTIQASFQRRRRAWWVEL